jgi:hypothetical protein
MKLRFVSCVAFALVLGLTRSAPAEVKSSEYYPLKVGTTWTYKANGQAITVKVAKHEKVGDVMCARLETSTGGKVVATEHIAVQKDGVYRYTMAGQTADPAVRFIKLPLKKGDTWKVSSKIGGQELNVEYTGGDQEVTVPAGTYKAVFTKTNEFEAGGQKMQATIWYAKGVGMVKTFMKIGQIEVVLELDKFEAGK